MNQSRPTFGGGAEDMRLDRLHALEKSLEQWIYQTRSTKARQLFFHIYFLIQIRKQNQLKHLSPDADHPAGDSLS